MTRRYLVIYETGPTNLSGFAPDVPGCASTGHSLEEMRANLREALEFHLEGLALDGQPPPQPTTRMAEEASPSGSPSRCPSPRLSRLDCSPKILSRCSIRNKTVKSYKTSMLEAIIV